MSPMEFHYTPDREIRIHRTGALRQLCAPFRSHDHGLPEWVKNSIAAYLRESWPPQDRIVVLFFTSRRADTPATISCLDLVGMTSKTIEQDFRHWADPDAATRGARGRVRIGELGGHGNGGKCYMTQMFDDHALLHTVRDGRKCVYGVKAGSMEFGYAPDADRGRDALVEDTFAELTKCLRMARTKADDLPDNVQGHIASATGFTFIQGVGPRDYETRIPVQQLINHMLGYHQMVTPLQQSQIYVIVDGRPFNGGLPLALPSITPLPGFVEPRVVPIPKTIRSADSTREISTTDNDRKPTGTLTLHTSDKNMRVGRFGARQARHTLTFRTDASGLIGQIAMASLDVTSSFRDNIYCDCALEALDPFQTNERGQLARSELTRAIETWVSAQVERLCEEIEALERRKMGQEDRHEVSRINDYLDQWKNQFIDEVMQGLYGQGDGSGQPTHPLLPAGIPESIQASITHPRAGVGVYIRPTVKFFDEAGRRVRPTPFKWVSDDNNVAMVDEELGLVHTFAFGTTNLTAETLDGKVTSNPVPLTVVRVISVRVTPNELTLPVASRHKLEAICQLPSGEETSSVHLTWIEDDSSIARVSSSGLVYAFNPGKTSVTAMDDHCRSDQPGIITVVPLGEASHGQDRGRGSPRILVSEVDTAPGEDAPPVFRADDPPTYQRVQDVDSNIWWINLASPFAKLYFDTSRGYGVETAAWRMYHLVSVP